MRDRIGDRDRAPRHVGMQPFDHAAVDLDDAFVGVFRQIESGDDFPRPRHLVRRRRERFVAGCDLLRVDQRLAVEAEIARLPAFGGKTFRVAEIVIDAVENIEAVGARRGDAGHQPRQHRRAARHDARAGVLGEIVGAHDEAGQPRQRIARRRRDLAGVEHGERRLHHRPEAHAGLGTDADEVLGDLAKLLGRRYLRHQQRIGAGGGDGEIVVPPGGIESIDAHQHLAAAEAAALQRPDDELARLPPWHPARRRPRDRG